MDNEEKYSKNFLNNLREWIIGNVDIGFKYLTMNNLYAMFSSFFSDKGISFNKEINTQFISRWCVADEFMDEIAAKDKIDDFILWSINIRLRNELDVGEYDIKSSRISTFLNHQLIPFNKIIYKDSNIYNIKTNTNDNNAINKTNDNNAIDKKNINLDLDKNYEFDIFFLLDFNDNENLKYEIIKNKLMEKNIKIYRMDEFIIEESIIDSILENIDKSKMCLFDISTNNLNVFFELGYAKGVKKNIMIISSNSNYSKIPFNLQGYQVHIFKNTILEIDNLVDKISKKFNSIN